MTFVSFEFALFLLIMVTARFSLGMTKTEHAYFVLLIVGSAIFYAWHVPWYLLLMAFTAVFHYAIASRIWLSQPGSRERRFLLVAAITISLSILGVFKYLNFSIETINHGLQYIGISSLIQPVDLVLPIGISFYTFHALSYTIDVYRGKTWPSNSLSEFFLYIAFFPQLVAGPIVRATEFLYQVRRKRSLSARVFIAGAYLIIRGLFLKLVVADNIASVVDKFWSQGAADAGNGILALTLAFLFSMQIFADFAGYTDIARGVAYILGFRLPLNFNAPYIATSFSEFWRRWHISLSRWLRDYLYVPLGGNRISGIRTYVNLLIVMLLGGLWHGAAYTFLIWGGIHGAALALERLLRLNNLRQFWLRIGWWLVVQLVVIGAWVYFRSSSAQQATAILNNIVSGRYSLMVPPEVSGALIFAIPVVAMHLRTLLGEHCVHTRAGRVESAVWAAVMCYTILTAYGHSFNPFIYFQF
jgi:alginate O-acetyltransferase complex protein AlgI